MFLLNQDYQNVINNAKSNLHPIMFLLNPNFDGYPFQSYINLHPIMFLLNPVVPSLSPADGWSFTSHYVPIKSRCP